MKPADSTLVYSTETGRVSSLMPASRSKGHKHKETAVQIPADGTVRLQRETKGRGGGTVIVITGVPLQGEQLKELAGHLKKKCGCGGTVKGSIIEIQGDHRELLLKELQSKGYRVKAAGG